MYLFLFCVWVAITHVECKRKEAIHKEFDVKPGGTLYEFEHNALGISCKFTYSCQGGTNEEWTLDMDKDGKIITINIARPSGVSYLFFQQFKVEVTGGKVIEGKAMTSSGVLNPEEYIVENNSVHHVEGKFGSELSAVSLKVEKLKKKKEL